MHLKCALLQMLVITVGSSESQPLCLVSHRFKVVGSAFKDLKFIEPYLYNFEVKLSVHLKTLSSNGNGACGTCVDFKE